MADQHDQSENETTHDPPGGAATSERPAAAQSQPSEEEMRAAYEAELSRITSSEMILQTAISLLNIGGRRLGLERPPAGPPADQAAAGQSSAAGGERDLEQVRDAIDGVSALIAILDRRMPRELGPLRDALAQLQIAYAREAQSAGNAAPTATQAPSAERAKPTGMPEGSTEGEQQPGPGPAQASGRLWVPGR